MPTQTLAQADAILKDLYVGPIIEQLNYKTYMLDQIERDSDHVDFTGRRAVFPIHSRRNRNRGSISDGGTLPVPGRQGYVDAIVGIKYHSQGLSISDQAAKQARGNEGAFVNLLDNETKLLAKDMRKDINRQVFGDGTARLASLTATSAGATVTVDSTQYLEVDDPVDVLDRATGLPVTGGAGRTILSINRSTKVVTLDAAVAGAVNTAGLYVSGNRVGAAVMEMDGLRNMVATARTLHGIDSSAAGQEYWNAKAKDAAGAIAGESLFGQLIDEVAAGGNGEVDTILTTRGIRRRLAETYQSQKRYNDAQAVNIHGGFSAIMVDEVPVVADDDVPKGFAFALNKDSFKWVELAKPDWLKSDDGTVWQLGVSATGSGRRAVWEAWFVWYASMANLAPNRNGVLTNAQDDPA